MNHEFTPGVINLTINPTFLRSGLAGHLLTHEELKVPEWAAKKVKPLSPEDLANNEAHRKAHKDLNDIVKTRKIGREFSKTHPDIDNTEELEKLDNAVGLLFGPVVESNGRLREFLQRPHALPR
jgi:hypothetical protein